MPKLWIINTDSLPAPRTGFDLAVWAVSPLPPPTALRTWAGWANCPVVALDPHTHAALSFTAEPREWRNVALAVGDGHVWRYQGQYVAWLSAAATAVPEVARALALAGTVLIIAPGQAPDSRPWLDPLWRVVQANQVYGLALGVQPRLFVPCEAGAEDTGELALSREIDGWSIDLDTRALLEAQRLYPIRAGLRPALYKRLRWWSS